jgi:GxxExxY protein
MAITAFSTLPDETEALLQRIIGCALQVHRQLGPGFLESVYTEALCIELEVQGLPFERERSVVVTYRDRKILGQRVDLIVGGAVIVEVKAVARLDPLFQAKLISYLRTTGFRAGLLVNFNSELLKDGLKRIVL